MECGVLFVTAKTIENQDIYVKKRKNDSNIPILLTYVFT